MLPTTTNETVCNSPRLGPRSSLLVPASGLSRAIASWVGTQPSSASNNPFELAKLHPSSDGSRGPAL